MKISQEAVTDANTIRDYGDGFLLVQHPDNTTSKLTENCLLSADKIISPSPIKDLQNLTQVQIEFLQKLDADVLIMTVSRPDNDIADLLQQLMRAEIAAEVMMLGPACRTFNLLLSEGRKPVLCVRF